MAVGRKLCWAWFSGRWGLPFQAIVTYCLGSKATVGGKGQGYRELRNSSGVSAIFRRKRALTASISPGWRPNLAHFFDHVGERCRKLKVRDCPAGRAKLCLVPALLLGRGRCKHAATQDFEFSQLVRGEVSFDRERVCGYYRDETSILIPCQYFSFSAGSRHCHDFCSLRPIGAYQRGSRFRQFRGRK